MTTYTRDSEWTTHDGRVIRLRDLEDAHLANVVDWVLTYGHAYSVELTRALLAEAAHRELSGEFLSRAQIPWKNPNGDWVVGMEVVSGKGRGARWTNGKWT